ncbi:MAG TPA: hypothetical protein VK826_07000, partial [Bacteroidia bacterium]|nr:hypothetical protein [Bacteroidia bacterium]
MKHLFSIAAACVLLSWANTASAQSSCNNQDFEDSTFTNWSAATGLNTNGILQPITWTSGVVSNGNNAACTDVAARHTILTVNGLDPTVTDPLTLLPDTQMTLLAPNGGVASVRLGNSNINYEAEKLVLPYTVTSSNTWFQFQYASVMQDPGHQWHEQPFFMVNVYDQTMTAIPSLCDTIWAGDITVPYLISGNDPYLLYRRWTPLSIDLSAFVGTNVTIEFVNADCVFSGHFGYTYIDVSCFGSAIPNVWPGDCDYDLQANIVDVLT